MADPFQLLTNGQSLESGVGPFNVQWHNAVTEAVRDFRRREIGEPRQKSVEMPYDPFVWLANVSGETLAQFTAIGIRDLVTFPTTDDSSDFRYRMCFYSAPLEAGMPFAITQSTIHANDKFAAKRAVVAGEDEPPSDGWVRVIGTAAAWDTLERYAVGEQVTYGGDTYVCIKPHTGQTPATGTYWVKLGTVRGRWDADSAYSIGEIVPRANVGEIAIDGVSRLLLNIKSSKHQYAGINSDGEMVSQATDGPLRIITKVDGTGPQWAIVRFRDDTATLPTFSGTGAITLAAATCDGDGTFLYTPGGALVLGVPTCAGTGTFTAPVFTGSGTPSTGAATCAGIGKSYDVPPSGRLFTQAATCAGVGTVVDPPVGFSRLFVGVPTCSGTGTVTKPTFTGSGALTTGAATCKGRGHGQVATITSINSQTGPAVTIDSANSWIGVSQSSNTITLTFDSGSLPPTPSINGEASYSFTLSSADGTVVIGPSSGGVIDFAARIATSLVSGILSTTAQDIAGDKTFYDNVYISGNIDVAGTSDFHGLVTCFNNSGYTDDPDVIISKVGGKNYGVNGGSGLVNNSTLQLNLAGVSADSGYAHFNQTKSDLTETMYFGILSAGAFDGITGGSSGSSGILLARIISNIYSTFPAWSGSSVNYTLGTSIVSSGGYIYQCVLTHVSDADSEPGVGVDWETYWVLKFSAGGAGSFFFNPSVTIADDTGTSFEQGYTGIALGLRFISGWLVDGDAPLVSESDIASSAVTNAKLADAPAQSIKANLTGSSAAPTDAVVGDFTAGTAESGNLLIGWDSSGDLKKYSNVRLKAATDDHWEILPAEAF